MTEPIAFVWMVNTPDRLVGLHATLFFINQSKYRDQIHVWVAASSPELQDQIVKIIKSPQYSPLQVYVFNVNDTSWHGYKKKLATVIGRYTYFIKCDDDLFYSHHVLDYFIENRSKLDDPNTVWMFPTASINSLTTDTFIEDFIKDGEVKAQIYTDFGQFNYAEYPSHNGTDDLEPLRQFFYNMRGVWNPTALRDYMWHAKYFNGGEHPIRHSNPAIVKLNTYIIDHIERVFEETNFHVEPIRGFYQAQFYMMKSKVWFEIQQLVANQQIPRGLIDETEINWFVKYGNKTALLVRNAFVIHPALQGVNLNYYHNMIYQKIHAYIGA